MFFRPSFTTPYYALLRPTIYYNIYASRPGRFPSFHPSILPSFRAAEPRALQLPLFFVRFMRLCYRICDQKMTTFPVLHICNQSLKVKMQPIQSSQCQASIHTSLPRRLPLPNLDLYHLSTLHRSLKEEEGAAEAAYIGHTTFLLATNIFCMIQPLQPVFHQSRYT